MKKILLLILVLFYNLSFGQLEKLKGTWISEENELISIVEKNSSKLTSKINSNDFYLKIKSDTLSFQSKYYTSADNYKKMIVDRYDLKILNLNDSLLIAKPISNFSKEFFGSENIITFKNQKYINDKTFMFDKLVFHTSSCFGSCPIINLEIASDRNIKINREYIKDRTESKKDFEKSGNFIGKIPEIEFKKLIELIIKSKITTLKDTEDNNMFCCDGAIKTIILYHNGKRNYFKAMFEHEMVTELINFLYQISGKMEMEKVSEEFKFEQ